jgi:hypothetical protein
MNQKSQEEIERLNPFPEDGTYQDNELNDENIPKIPILIQGYNSFAVVAKAGEISAGTFCGEKLENNLEKGIENVINWLRHNARVHLTLLEEKRIEPSGDERLAEIILSYKGKLENLCKIVYSKCFSKNIEPVLGRYNDLEREIINTKD